MLRGPVSQLSENPLALWRPKRSKSSQQKTFEEQKMLAESQNSIGATVASAGSYLGGWLGALASTATGSQPA